MTSTPPRLRPLTDVSPAEWVVEGMGEFASGVKGLLPSCFDSYARILHPAWDAARKEPVTWAMLAAATGRQMHSRVQFDALVGARSGEPRPYEADVGQLRLSLLSALCEVLAKHTGTPERCWFCLWEGWGWIEGSPAVAGLASEPGQPMIQIPPAFSPEIMDGPRVSLPGRKYILFEGPLGAAGELGWRYGEILSAAHPERGFDPDEFEPQSPSIFWPNDRSWCVATEIDLDSTYVGGSRQLVDALLADPRFEAWPVQLDDRIDSGADDLNL